MDKKQSQISSFFTPRNKKPLESVSSKKRNQPGSSPNSNFQFKKPLTTPEKIGLIRSDSVLTKSSNDGFDEITSSDTSFDSPEVNNFRNPVYEFTRPNQRPSQNQSQSQNSKRSYGSLLDRLESMEQGPKKVAKKFRPNAAPAKKTSAPAVLLSNEQLAVINEIVDKKKNVFYTGSAGTGKSVVLRELVKRLQMKYGYQNVGVTASTGLAACNIGGQTLHRYLGIGLATADPLKISQMIQKKPMIKKRWQSLKVLIVDEISMIDGVLFTKLDAIGKELRKRDTPFGGIQVVCTGDFFQLPPVSKGGQANYCFECDSWKRTIEKTLLLTQVFRQQGDNELIHMLNSLRFGDMNSSTVSQFLALQKEKKYVDGIEPTELYPTRDEVKRANERRMQGLPSKPVVYTADDSTGNEFDVKLLENLMCEKVLTLKPGAQVMYLKNRDDGIVNGSIGKVLFLCTETLYRQIEERYDQSYLYDDSMLQEVVLLTSKIGRPGEMSSTEQAVFEEIPPERKDVFLQLLSLAMVDKSVVWPLVCFKDRLGNNLPLLVQKEEFTIDVGVGNTRQITRNQLPLLLSWAMSIHKSQGQTIQRLRVDLRRIFEKGQVYVALSRAVDKENLEIRNFDARKIIASDKVKDFYKKLETIA